MCSVLEVAKAYRFEEMILEEIDDCIRRILNYQAEMARIQFYGKLVPEVRDTRKRKRKVMNAMDDYGEKLYLNVQKSVVRLNDLAAQKGMGKVIELADVVSKESVTAFCADLAYELATGSLVSPIDPAPAALVVAA